MVSPSAEAPDGLEIVSVGALYGGGPWEKKYWSCSRGKDRYPYPVGYRAVRTRSGQTYRMEIREGPKGPVFVVSSKVADSCSGQTPDMAWENFQKKSVPKVKNWHGKRFSCNVDGVELFGFRNPFVQRLLRELVANVSGASEQSLISPNFCNGTLLLDDEVQTQEPSGYANLLPYLGKQECTGKRSRKKRIDLKIEKPDRHTLLYQEVTEKEICDYKQDKVSLSNLKSNNELLAEDEKILPINAVPPGNETTTSIFVNSEETGTVLNGDAPNLDVEECRNIKEDTPLVAVSQLCAQNVTDEVPLEITSRNVANGDCNPLLENCLHLGLKGSNEYFKEHITSKEQTMLCVQVDSRLQSNNKRLLHMDNEMLEKLSDAKVVGAGQVMTEDNDGETPLPRRVRFRINMDLCIPDTLDNTQDVALDIGLENCEGRDKEIMDDLITIEETPTTEHHFEGIVKEITATDELQSPRCISTSLPDEKNIHVMPLQDESESAVHPGPGVHFLSGSSNSSSERTDLDSAGEELARSMMTFLLPRAVPLLNKTYQRKKKRSKGRETKRDPSLYPNVKAQIESVQNSICNNVICQGLHADRVPSKESEQKLEENVHAVQSISGTFSLLEVCETVYPINECIRDDSLIESESFKDMKSVIPDSLDDEQFVSGAGAGYSSCFRFNEADKEPSSVVECRSSMLFKVFCETEVYNEPSISYAGNNEFKERNIHPDGVKKEARCNSACACAPHLEEQDHACNDKDEKGVPENGIPAVDFDENELFLDPDNVLKITTLHSNREMSYDLCSDRFTPECRKQICSFKHKNVKLPERTLCSTTDLENTVEIIPNTTTTVVVTPEKFGIDFCSLSRRDTAETDTRNRANAHHTYPTEFDGRLADTSDFQALEVNALSSAAETNSFECKVEVVSCVEKCNDPLSEVMTCRNTSENEISAEFVISKVTKARETSSSASEVDAPTQPSHLNAPSHKSEWELLVASTTVAPQNQLVTCTPTSEFPSSIAIANADLLKITASTECQSGKVPMQDPEKVLSDDISSNARKNSHYTDEGRQVNCLFNNDSKDHSCASLCKKLIIDSCPSLDAKTNKSLLEPIGCYIHPNPILCLFLVAKKDEIRICVVSGLTDGNDRTILIYKVSLEKPIMQCPSFLGYTSISLLVPDSSSDLNTRISSERSYMQFAPNGEFLILHGSIKVPCCREKNANCLCSFCKSDHCSENGIKVVSVKFGYVSIIKKLITNGKVYSLLVCEPSHIVAAECGGLHVWNMDSNWSATLEEFQLSGLDFESPSILELKTIPHCSSLIIGYNGVGGFGLWDISKRVLLGQFYSPAILISQVLPVGLCSLGNDAAQNIQGTQKNIKGEPSWLHQGENNLISPIGAEIAICLLVSASSLLGPSCGQLENSKTDPVRWRFAILAKSKVTLGSILDPRASVAEVSLGHGIIGTCDGHVYMWKISTGEKVADLNSYRGGEVSCIAVDAKSVALAAASSGHLLVYLRKAGMP